MSENVKPWYRSIKKVAGLTFLSAVLIVGIVDILKDPTHVMDILELFSWIGLLLLGVTSAVKLGHKAIDKSKGDM